MTVYQTYINVLNSDMKAAFEEANPFVFNHVQHLSHAGGLDDVGPCVVLATPSMLHSPVCLARALRDRGAATPNNGVIIADFRRAGHARARDSQRLSSQNHFARDGRGDCSSEHVRRRHLLQRARGLPADAGSSWTRSAPPHVVLVHGEAGEMGRCSSARSWATSRRGRMIDRCPSTRPRNCQSGRDHITAASKHRQSHRFASSRENPPKMGDRVRRSCSCKKDFGTDAPRPGGPARTTPSFERL